MSWCDKCPKPGNCCKKMQISAPRNDGAGTEQVTFWLDEGPDAARAYMKVAGLPFEPLEVLQVFETAEGRKYGNYSFTCPKLGDDGRCTIYENRPQLCRDYKAGQDPLCVFTKRGVVRASHREKT